MPMSILDPSGNVSLDPSQGTGGGFMAPQGANTGMGSEARPAMPTSTGPGWADVVGKIGDLLQSTGAGLLGHPDPVAARRHQEEQIQLQRAQIGAAVFNHIIDQADKSLTSDQINTLAPLYSNVLKGAGMNTTPEAIGKLLNNTGQLQDLKELNPILKGKITDREWRMILADKTGAVLDRKLKDVKTNLGEEAISQIPTIVNALKQAGADPAQLDESHLRSALPNLKYADHIQLAQALELQGVKSGARALKTAETEPTTDRILAGAAQRRHPGNLEAQNTWIQQQKANLIGLDAAAREAVIQRMQPPKIAAGGGIVDKATGQIYEPANFTQEEINKGKDKYAVIDKANRDQIGYIEGSALPALQALKDLVPKLAVKAKGRNLINYVQKEVAKGIGVDSDVANYVRLKKEIALEETKVYSGSSRLIAGVFQQIEETTLPSLKQTLDVQNSLLNTDIWSFENRARALKKQPPISQKDWNASHATSPTDQRINVISPNGQRGDIPASQLDKALKTGYKRAP